MKRNPYKPYHILIIVLVSMLANVIGRIIGDTFEPPLWMDCFGTFLTAYALGPVCGAIVGIAGNLLHGFLNPVSSIYSLTSIFIALIVGYMAKKGWMNTLFKTMSLSLMVTGVCVFISVILNIVFYDGQIGNKWGEGISELFGSWGLPRLACIILGQFYMDFLDKVITLVALYAFIKFYRIIRPHLPFWLKITPPSENEEENQDRIEESSAEVKGGQADTETSPQAETINLSETKRVTDTIQKSETKPQADFHGEAKSSAETKPSEKTEYLSGRNLLIFVLFFSFAAFFPYEASGQTKQISPEKSYNSYASTIYNKSNGLSGGKTNDIACTNDGILWIGTYEGLYRHNGNEFRLMNEFESIKAVRCLYVDDEGRLIVGTNDNGLSIIINESVMNVIEEKDGLPSDAVRSIIRGSDGFYYVGTSESLAILSIANGLYVIAIIPEIQTAISLSADEKEHIAAVTADGRLFILQAGGKILYSSQDRRVKFTACTFDQEGNLYASTEGNRVFIYSLNDQNKISERNSGLQDNIALIQDSQNISQDSQNISYFQAARQKTEIISDNTDSTEVKTERAVIRGASPKIVRQTEKTDTNFLSVKAEIKNITLKHINSFKFIDDVLFTCSDNGAGYIQNQNFYPLETGSFNNSIDNMTEDYQGNLWFTSSRLGLLKMCETSFSEIYASAGLPISVVNSTALFMGNLYFATDDGLMAIDSKTNKPLQNALTERFSGIRVRCLTICKDSSMWISSKSRGMTHVKTDGSIVTLGIPHQFRVAVELADGSIACGASDGIAIIQDDRIIQWITEKDGLENPVILSLSQTKNGLLLAGTDGGGIAVIEKNIGKSSKASEENQNKRSGDFSSSSENNSPYRLTRLLKKDDGLSSNVVLRTVNDFDGENELESVYAVTSNGLCYITFGENENSKSSENKDSPNLIPENLNDGALESSSKQNDQLDQTLDDKNSLTTEEIRDIKDKINIRILSNFPFSNNYDLVVRPNKNIFVLSGAGIFVVNREELLNSKNGEKLDYELLDLKKGLRGSLTANSWNYMDQEGNLYLSCDTGSSKINLNTYDKIEHSYRMQLKSIIIDGKRHILQKDIPYVIQSDADTVEIIPEIINYSINTPYISLYFEGVDDKPAVMLQSELSSSVYMNLKSGNYKFHIAVLDSKGRNTVEEAVYNISKTYKIYNNWWFLVYTAGVAMLAIAWLTWFITSTIQGKRLEKQKQEMDAIKKQITMGNETIFSIANAVEARDKSTGKHSLRVSEYAVLLARELGFSDEELNQIRQTGLLHDIGKIGVPDAVLNKPDRLTDEEYAIMKTHTTIGGEILKDFTLIPHVDEGAKFHHERYDGSGYPNGLKGEEIPLNARIIGLADAFDAMTANRVYRKALNMDYVIQELKRCSGSQFDPTLVEILLKLIESGEISAEEIQKKD
ncbi:MAG: HD domain-containing protein [Treponema sp.]|nr:HD domain-containing protein [Treponema sp.]